MIIISSEYLNVLGIMARRCYYSECLMFLDRYTISHHPPATIQLCLKWNGW